MNYILLPMAEEKIFDVRTETEVQALLAHFQLSEFYLNARIETATDGTTPRKLHVLFAPRTREAALSNCLVLPTGSWEGELSG